jgi:hypothetical protein
MKIVRHWSWKHAIISVMLTLFIKKIKKLCSIYLRQHLSPISYLHRNQGSCYVSVLCGGRSILGTRDRGRGCPSRRHRGLVVSLDSLKWEHIWWKPKPLWKPMQTTAKKSSKWQKITHVDNMMIHNLVKYLVKTWLRLWVDEIRESIGFCEIAIVRRSGLGPFGSMGWPLQ